MGSLHRLCTLVLAAAFAAACGSGGTPNVTDLRESFAAQLGANKFVQNFTRNGSDLEFSGPGAEGGTAKWRVHIDEAAVEPNEDTAKPFKGVVKSSWYSDGQLVRTRGRDSNLPLELTSTGLAQECWALWNPATKKWEWE